MIIADTGFWLALANRKDTHHRRATTALLAHKEPLITTWPVVTETCHLLLSRLGPDAMLAFMRSFEVGAFEIFEVTQADADRLTQLMQKYKDLPMDLADASLVLLAERRGEGKIFSTDQRDFQSYRWKCHEPFQNLLLG